MLNSKICFNKQLKPGSVFYIRMFLGFAINDIYCIYNDILILCSKLDFVYLLSLPLHVIMWKSVWCHDVLYAKKILQIKNNIFYNIIIGLNLKQSNVVFYNFISGVDFMPINWDVLEENEIINSLQVFFLVLVAIDHVINKYVYLLKFHNLDFVV